MMPGVWSLLTLLINRLDFYSLFCSYLLTFEHVFDEIFEHVYNEIEALGWLLETEIQFFDVAKHLFISAFIQFLHYDRFDNQFCIIQI